MAGALCASQNGVCSGSRQVCRGASGWLACGAALYAGYSANYEQSEISCDARDNDCDGVTDTDAPAPLCAEQRGVCAGSTAACGGVSGWQACSAARYGGSYQVTENTCDLLDNDCDGGTDDGFKNPTTLKYDQNTACGNCFTNCTIIYALPFAEGVCDASGAPVCRMNCLSDHFDLNQIPDDGCEFALDTAAVYVSVNDALALDNGTCGLGPVGTGTSYHPCRSITYAQTRAVALARTKVLVADGLYLETVTVATGQSLLGGYRADTWERHLASTLTLIRGTDTGTHRNTIIASSIATATDVQGFVLQGQVNPTVGGNSYTVYASTSPGLRLLDNVIYAGSGGPGQNRSAAGSGTNGTNGGSRNDPGNAALYDAKIADDNTPCDNSDNRQYANGGALTCGGDDVGGGQGGGNRCTPDPDNEYSGYDGAVGQAGSGALGGVSGTGGDAGDDGAMNNSLCSLPSNTMVGATGANGASGTSGPGGTGCNSSLGGVVGGHWVGSTGTSGGAGGNGGGGGGGGAGGGGLCESGTGCASRDRLGGHGGGGGSGGCGATGGDAGGPGGASIAVFLAGGVAPTLSGNTIYQGFGGNGGDGGNGGVAGTGGSGGEGGECSGSCWCYKNGGKGGEGGNGGPGGGGGGGCGGASFGVYTSGVTGAPNYCSANQVLGGAAGVGGAGGVSLGTSGSSGTAGSLAPCSIN